MNLPPTHEEIDYVRPPDAFGYDGHWDTIIVVPMALLNDDVQGPDNTCIRP
jgi:hypothetical protein